MPLRLEAACFADEIAIDFPSVGNLLARAREQFLAEETFDRGLTLEAEVAVSSLEAYRGTVVPVELRLMTTCERCGGRGETWAEPCAPCRGTGCLPIRHYLKVPVPPRVTHGACLYFRLGAPLDALTRVQVKVAITA